MAKDKEEVKEIKDEPDAGKGPGIQLPAAAGGDVLPPAKSKSQDEEDRKGRTALLGAKRYVVGSHPVGPLAPGKVVSRETLIPVAGEKDTHDAQREAGIARLLDLGAISPAPDQDASE